MLACLWRFQASKICGLVISYFASHIFYLAFLLDLEFVFSSLIKSHLECPLQASVRSGQCIPIGIHLMKMHPNQDTFKFMQGHVIMNQPMRIVFRAFVLGHYLFLEAHSFPRASLEQQFASRNMFDFQNWFLIWAFQSFGTAYRYCPRTNICSYVRAKWRQLFIYNNHCHSNNWLILWRSKSCQLFPTMKRFTDRWGNILSSFFG